MRYRFATPSPECKILAFTGAAIVGMLNLPSSNVAIISVVPNHSEISFNFAKRHYPNTECKSIEQSEINKQINNINLF